MTQIEQQVEMPVGAQKISNYDRYYTQKDLDEVVGIFVGSGQRGGRTWVKTADQLPAIHDSGCAVVNVIYDLKNHKVTTFCSGVA